MSAATASRALRGLNVHKKFRGKAESAAKELGYVLNEPARSLRSERTMTVGMVYHELTSMLGTELLRAMSAGLEEIGYSLFISTAQGRNDLYDHLVHRFLQRRVDALVCVHSNGEGAALQGFAAADTPVMALITKSGGYADLPMMRPSIQDASGKCINGLRELGHRAVCILSQERFAVPIGDFISAAKAGRMKFLVHKFDAATFDATATFRKLMTQDEPPTVILAMQQEAVRLAEASRQLKIDLPRDCSLVSIRDRTQTPPTLQIALSTIHIDPQPLGLAAAAALRNWLLHGVALDPDVPIEVGQWLERSTTGPALGS